MNQSFMKYQSLIYYTLHKLKAPLPYEDYVQEAYIVYEKCRKTYNPSLSRFSTYFTYQLIYCFQSILRKNHHLPFFIESFQENDPFTDVITYLDLLQNCKLTDFEKEVLLLFLKGCRVNEASYYLQCSPSTIKRMRKTLRLKIFSYINS